MEEFSNRYGINIWKKFPIKSDDTKLESVGRAGGIGSHTRKKMVNLLRTLCSSTYIFN